MSDGREEREEQKKRRELEDRDRQLNQPHKKPEDRTLLPHEDPWQPERPDS